MGTQEASGTIRVAETARDRAGAGPRRGDQGGTHRAVRADPVGERRRICLWATVAESPLVILLRHDIAAAFTTDEPVRVIVGLAYAPFAVRRYLKDPPTIS